MEITVVLNNFPKTHIFFTTFFISIKNNFYTIFFIRVKMGFCKIVFVAMVTKLKNLSCYALETTVGLNNFPKPNICVTIFFINLKIGFYTIFVVAMVT